MAATSRGEQLTEQQRVEQQQIRAAFLLAFLQLWPLLDGDRLDDTGPGWINAVLRLIRQFRLRSAESATRYYLEYRAAEAPNTVARPRLELPPGVERPPPSPRPSPTPRRTPAPAPRRTPERTPTRQTRPSPAPPPATPSQRRAGPTPTRDTRRARLDLDESAFQPREERRARIEIPDIDWGPSDRAVKVSMAVTGPVAQKSAAARGKTPEQARKDSLVQASGAASRHVLTGGRKSLLTLLEDDPQALGWARVTDGDPCAFCAMLASRGPVYGSEASAGFSAHDHCACTAEPVYSRDAPWPGRAREFQQLWNDHIRGQHSGKDAIRAFRRLYEQQQRDARRGEVA